MNGKSQAGDGSSSKRGIKYLLGQPQLYDLGCLHIEDYGFQPIKPLDSAVLNRMPGNEKRGMCKTKWPPDGNVESVRRTVDSQASTVTDLPNSARLHEKTLARRLVIGRKPLGKMPPSPDLCNQKTDRVGPGDNKSKNKPQWGIIHASVTIRRIL